ncbi:pantoate--beta-alanine ligase [Bradyrhizobium sp. GM22.5]
MSYLHDGHLALVEASRMRTDVTVVSIVVNPTQFGLNEDLSTYPRDFVRDEELCRNAGVAILFAPDAREVYPTQFETFVEPGEIAKPLCGTFRPGHFRSVATIVCKLFNMVKPDLAVFGQKDSVSNVPLSVERQLISTCQSRFLRYQQCGMGTGSQ